MRLLLLCGMFALAASSAAAELFPPPEWREAPHSIHERWAFSTGKNPASPETSKNIHGSTAAQMHIGHFGEGWFETFGGLSRIGLWDLGIAGTISVTLPALPSGVRYGELRVRVEYYKPMYDSPTVAIGNATEVQTFPEAVVENELGKPGAWYGRYSIWQADESQPPPVVVVTASNSNSLVERLEIDAQILRWRLQGDLNNDCKVDILDLMLIRKHLNADTSEGTNWRYDVNDDGVINMLDLIYVRNKLGNTCEE